MKEKTERVSIRVPQSLDKQILIIAQKHFSTKENPNGDYSKAIRFLCQLALVLYDRLDGKIIESMT